MNTQENIYSRIARIFVENSQLSLLIVLSTFLFGALAFYATPKQYDPEITLPAFQITTVMPGATPTEVERLITNQIENTIYEIPTIDEVTSQSLPGGVSVVNVLFTIGSDMDKSTTTLTQKIRTQNLRLPQGALPSTIVQIDPENVPIMTVALTSEEYGQDGLRMVALDIKEQLKTVPGVSAVEVYGGRKHQVNVLVDPRKMQYRGIGINTILNTLHENNLYGIAGTLSGSTYTTPVEITESGINARTIEQMRIGGSATSPLFLRDVATVSEGLDLSDTNVQFIEKADDTTKTSDAVYLSIAKTKGVNITTVASAIEKKLQAIEKTSLPTVVTLRITRNEGETAREEIMTLTEHLALAIGIVTITLMLFLGLRVALVVATAIPLTLALVFITSYFFDATINRITLFALIFSLGLLVDDAIVVLENIHRHLALKHHASSTEAILSATGEVGDGVMLSTLTAVVVFAPMGIVTGMMGAYMGPIAFFAPVARLASLVVAYTLSPYLASLYFKKETRTEHKEHIPKYIAHYRAFITKILDNEKLQKRIVRWTVVFTFIVFMFPFVGIVHFRMLPKADKEQVYAYIDLDTEASLERTSALTTQVTNTLMAIPEVTSIESFIGAAPVPDFNGLFRGSAYRTNPSQATLKINLTPKGERSKKSEDVVVELRALIAKEFAQDVTTRIKLVEDPPGPPVLATMLVRIKGPDTEIREAIAKDVMHQMRTVDGVVDTDTSLPVNEPTEQLVINRNALAQTGVSNASILNTLSVFLSGQPAGILHDNSLEPTNIFVHSRKSERVQADQLASFGVQNASGTFVPLRGIVTRALGTTQAPIQHDAREPVSVITAETEGRSVVYTTIDLMKFLYHYSLPSHNGERTHMNLFGFTYTDAQTHDTYTVEWGGEFEMTLKNFRDLGMAMLLSYLLIYGILVAQFKSFKSAGLIMTTILLAFAGVLPGFAILDYFFGMYFSATSMIGAIALGGIVVGNAILLLDFIEQLRAKGVHKKDAIIRACETRLQPIALTAITAILGAIVIVADPVWSGLAWALVFGLSLSTILTLVLFPVIYLRYGTE